MFVLAAVLAAASPAHARPFHCGGRLVEVDITQLSGRSDEIVTISCEHDRPRLVAKSFMRGEGGIRANIKITPAQFEHVWQLAEAAHWKARQKRCGDGEGVLITSFEIRQGKTRRTFECHGGLIAALDDLAAAVGDLDPGE